MPSAAEPVEPMQPSAELLAAQEQLLQLRRQRRETRRAAGQEMRTDAEGRLLAAAEHCPVSEEPAGLPDNMAALLQSGAGLHSIPFTNHIRAALARQAGRNAAGPSPALVVAQPTESGRLSTPPRCKPAALPAAAPTSAPSQLTTQHSKLTTIPLLPDLALAILRRELAAPARLWLLLRLLDVSGKGWLYLQEAQEQLTGPESPLRFCAGRQLRSLIAQGEPLFWERRPEREGGRVRIWLRSPAKVARALDCPRLAQPPVALPVRHLLAGIGQVRAHFYASFHSARGEGMTDGEWRMNDAEDSPLVTRRSQCAAPISRETLRRLSAVSPSSQRAYEQQAGVSSRTNWALGPRKGLGEASSARGEELAWRHGRALFTFVDKEGKQGRPGAEYLAWQLPNSYAGPHARLAQARRRRMNQQLRDLALKGTPGNGERLEAPQTGASVSRARAYFADGRAAATALSVRPADNETRYWPGASQKGPASSRHRGRSYTRGRFWYAMGGEGVT